MKRMMLVSTSCAFIIHVHSARMTHLSKLFISLLVYRATGILGSFIELKCSPEECRDP